ncbi:MAG: FAD-dependent oxidoreductase [Pseudomonadota bacterium]
MLTKPQLGKDIKPEIRHVVVIGAGPAGLTAAHALVKAGIAVTVLEKRKGTGGLGGTTAFEGRAGTYRFDYGGHRFITSNRDLLELVENLVGEDFLYAERRSVIRLDGRTYDYPLSIRNLLTNAPASLLVGATADLARKWISPEHPEGEADFETWTRARFGPTLYKRFFAGYTEKLWGIRPSELSGDWAEQRISLIDLKDVARRLLPGSEKGLRTYARTYRYPRHGFGMIFDRLADRVTELGADIRTGVSVTGLTLRGQRISKVETDAGAISCDAVISTVPLPAMVQLTGGHSSLSFRGLRFFNMMMDVEDISPNTWQYLSDPHILATRLQEPKRRSPEMAPRGKTSIMLEIPCDPGQPLWEMPDDMLFAKVCPQLASLGVDPEMASGEYFSTRAATAYPLMRQGYQLEREKAFRHLGEIENLTQCGRQGSFRYVFTDTAMEMGQMAAEALIDGQDLRDAVRDHRNERVVIETESIA